MIPSRMRRSASFIMHLLFLCVNSAVVLILFPYLQRRQDRAKRFGVLSESDKKAARAERLPQYSFR